ncbi:Transketolase [Aedoeadaptatus ivorii]|uniref:Transketolase n=1 Tax=Aedoeadaptatus ivorii TaxID=54006 RepID=A0A448V1Z4_9FIRM|nr:transketolase [Peptoniphilus ivorii]MDQ0508121.1 transketolase [Peptoniphilus ivorii]VEJ35852.1 Transketolase [Peptoniphilus ivorii]
MQNKYKEAINTLRALSIDQVDTANSGHPGLPLGAAPMAWSLWAHEMDFWPEDRSWPNRDRFILSAGHGSALLYSLLHLFGYPTTADDLRGFRTLHSKTPGHPEYGHTEGVETTTGPLGAGISTAVGFAMAESRLAAQFNKPGYDLIDHHTYVLAGDGDLMEGISNEASSLAGTLELGKLIVLYDSNNITIEGDTDLSFKEDVAGRYRSLGWHVLTVEDGEDIRAIVGAIDAAKQEKIKPSLIEIKTKIGFGSPLEGSAQCHGSPLGADDNEATKKKLGYGEAEFVVSAAVKEQVAEILAEKEKNYRAWKELEAGYRENFPAEYEAFVAGFDAEKKDLSFMDEDEYWQPVEKDMATRASSHVYLQKVARGMGNLFGGSADLAPSNKSDMKEEGQYSVDNRAGGNVNFGVREHAMAAIVNGIYLHGGFRSYGATFLVFSDYMKPQLRLAALMHLPVTFLFTHDSIGVGEDGPTHQPIEHLTMLRSIPNMIAYRPADSTEVAAAWYVAMHSKETPVALALTRQGVPELEGTSKEALKGGYVVKKESGSLDLILIASGSELAPAVSVAEKLAEEGCGVRVVSMPSQELFEAQSAEYRQSVLPEEANARVSVEAGSRMSWYRYVGRDGLAIGIDEFGASGKADAVFDLFGLTEEKIYAAVRQYLDGRK